MINRRTLVPFVTLALGAAPVAAQQNPTARRATQMYEQLDYANAVILARRALGERLSREDRIQAYEVVR